LQPLPGHGAPASGAGFPTLTETGGAPPAATNPADVCPGGARVQSYDITALQNPDSLVDFGDVMYAPSNQEALLLSGALQPEPLVMRVNEGDCLRISLTNHFSSERASIDLAKLNAAGPGAAVGWNADGSAAPGETVEYEFYADAELGTSLFFNLAAPDTIADGAFGAVVVEPAGSTWRSPFGPGPARTGVRADILHPDGNFREHVLLMQESDERIGQNVMPYTIEVRNFSGINYRTDPFFETSGDVPGRLDVNPDPSLVFDSATHGDPRNLVRAYVGDQVRLRVGLPAAEQSNTFALDGHRFPWEPDVEGSTQLAAMGMFAGESHELNLIGGAGGAGDYLFGNGRGPHVEAGMWGIFRTYDAPQIDLLPIHPPTAPTAPSGVSGVGGDARVVVSWSAPVSNGHSPITGYTVTAAPGGATCTTSGARTCTVTGLTNGTPYTFTVTATNAVGTGPASPASAPVTPVEPPATIERWAGANRYATSVRISQEAFPDGADVVFLATGTNFADALAAGPAAGSLDAPVLLTATNQLPSVVRAELQRLDPSVVYVLGGPAAISPSVEAQAGAATNAVTTRLAGPDRYATAAAVAEFAFASADTVYVAVGTVFADALSAGSPGGILERPVILTGRDRLPEASRAQISRLGNPDVIVLGGPAAVGDAVFAELEQLTSGSVRRVSGTNRYETSVAVSADAFGAADTVFLSTGTNFPDALSAAPAATSFGGPILLTRPACVPAAVISEIARVGADRIVVLGGPNAVSEAAAALTPCP
ncbi:cell wall-binding repeat-containing protein, partial [Ilumatobacter sp.]|uniref:cell wall-binding repeat-containing protein n=1 Tax=Ilumatobacter sp. TaxID=1967498 RepID=UPI003C3C90C6